MLDLNFANRTNTRKTIFPSRAPQRLINCIRYLRPYVNINIADGRIKQSKKLGKLRLIELRVLGGSAYLIPQKLSFFVHPFIYCCGTVFPIAVRNLVGAENNTCNHKPDTHKPNNHKHYLLYMRFEKTYYFIHNSNPIQHCFSERFYLPVLVSAAAAIAAVTIAGLISS